MLKRAEKSRGRYRSDHVYLGKHAFFRRTGTTGEVFLSPGEKEWAGLEEKNEGGAKHGGRGRATGGVPDALILLRATMYRETRGRRLEIKKASCLKRQICFYCEGFKLRVACHQKKALW